MRTLSLILMLLLCLALAGCRQRDQDSPRGDARLANDRLYGSYRFDRPDAVDIGVQPLSLPESSLTELLSRDNILARQLQAANLTLNSFPCYKGKEIRELMANGKLEAGILGDMQALEAAANGEVVIVALVKRGFSSIVSREQLLVRGLKGKRIAVPPGSVGHFTLLNALKNEGLTERDVELVGMEVAEMTGALERREVDAFSAWEPTPTVALSAHPGFHLVHRGTSFRFLCFRRDFAAAHPAEVRSIVAALARGCFWMRQSGTLDRVAQWVLASAAAFQGEPLRLKPEQVAHLTREDLLVIPAAPQVSERLLRDHELLWQEFRYLQQLGRIPAGVPWSAVRDSFALDLLRDVLSDGKGYALERFDYVK